MTPTQKLRTAAGAAVRRPARAAAGRGLWRGRLADAVGRALAQAGGGDLPDRGRVLLAISAISVLLEKHGGADDPMPATFSLPAGPDLRRLLLVLAAFAIYFLAMPLLGNMIASALFLLASMWLLSDDPRRSVAAAGGLCGRDRAEF